jgi:hypothetical protein
MQETANDNSCWRKRDHINQLSLLDQLLQHTTAFRAAEKIVKSQRDISHIDLRQFVLQPQGDSPVHQRRSRVLETRQDLPFRGGELKIQYRFAVQFVICCLSYSSVFLPVGVRFISCAWYAGV